MTHDEVKLIKEAKKLARDHGLFVVERADKFMLYRQCQPRNVLVGSRTTVTSLRRFVARVANVANVAPAK